MYTCTAAPQTVAWATALSLVLEWPIGRLLGGVTAGQRGELGSVFVRLRAALPAAGLEENRTAQFLSTSDPPPPISYPSSLHCVLSLSLSLSAFVR